jgi:hypothetical protein
VIAGVYVLSGVLAGISAIFLVFYTNSVSPSTFGNFYELYAIAAADWAVAVCVAANRHGFGYADLGLHLPPAAVWLTNGSRRWCGVYWACRAEFYSAR